MKRTLEDPPPSPLPLRQASVGPFFTRERDTSESPPGENVRRYSASLRTGTSQAGGWKGDSSKGRGRLLGETVSQGVDGTGEMLERPGRRGRDGRPGSGARSLGSSL